MPTRQQISVVLDEKFLSFVAKKKKDILLYIMVGN